MSSESNNIGYTTKSLYDVIKISLLKKNKDLMHFIISMNDNVLEDYNLIRVSTNLTLSDIMKRFENYTIVYFMIRDILKNANISSYSEKTREITNMFLKDELTVKDEKNKPSVYDNDDD